MPLAIQLLTRPARVAGLVAIAAAVAIVSAATAFGTHEAAAATAAAALVVSGAVIGVLAPLYGRGAAIGLWTARAAIAFGAAAVLVPDGRATTAVRIVAALGVLAGLRLVARGTRRDGDMPAWTCAAVAVGLAALLVAPGLGGGLLLGLALLAVVAAIHATFVSAQTTVA